jgi:hypothetical protein
MLTELVLEPLLGRRAVEVCRDASALGRTRAGAVIINNRRAAAHLRRDALLRVAERKLVIVTPRAAAVAFGRGKLTVIEASSDVVEPCAKIESENFLTCGLRRGDVVPWSRGEGAAARRVQEQIRCGRNVLAGLGFEIIATSVCGVAPSRDGHPVVLWRNGGHGGGVLVMDLEIPQSSALSGSDGNIASLIISNALGRPQSYFGTYVAPEFDYECFCDGLKGLVAAHSALRLREEGRSGGGRPIYSISLGPADAAVVYVDCGIHPDEWAPCYGVPLYLARLADEFERGLPWARALLSGLQVKCIPVLAPDGWDRNNRSPRGVNLNRNFPTHWKECADPEKGARPLSEPESRVVDRILRGGNVIVAVNWHETSANTNWVGYPRAKGRYAKYVSSIPSIFAQGIDGRHFYRQPAVWTQVYDQRNYHYHYTDSFPYLRDYSVSKSPFEINYADTFGIDGLIVEQYGNSDFSSTASPQRTDMSGFIMEMIFGLQIGLVCRNARSEEVRFTIPLAGKGRGAAIVYGPDGRVAAKKPLVRSGGTLLAQGRVPPGGVLVVELDPPPWRRRRR